MVLPRAVARGEIYFFRASTSDKHIAALQLYSAEALERQLARAAQLCSLPVD